MKWLEGKLGYVLLAGALVINICLQGIGFFTADSIGALFGSNLPLLLAALAQTVIMAAGGIDISIGNTIALANGIIIVCLNAYGMSFSGSSLAAIAAGTGVGLVNGIIIACFRVPPLLVTFAMSTFIKGLALMILPKPGGNVPTEVYRTYGGTIFMIPTALVILIVVVVFLVLAGRFRITNHMTAIGSNERNAYVSGVRVELVKVTAYAAGGAIAALSGVCLTALTATGDVRNGESFALQSIAAVIIGGMLGSGKWKNYILGAVSGALFLAVINNIVFYAFSYVSVNYPEMQISTYYQQLFSNFIIIFGLMSAALAERRNRRRGR
ncbi:hypothetical protein C818_02775 [Lachnospiraceae bacterium MD308]|nr:hypothetical protein C818_02775 [Lachnospiraceae bacterium MD308]